MNQDIEKLLEKYYDGETTLEEEKQLRHFFQKGNVPVHLESHAPQFNYFAEAAKQQPSLSFDSRLALMLDPPPKKPIQRFANWFVRIAAALALLIVGFAGGFGYFKMQNQEIAAVAPEDLAPTQEMKVVLALGKTSSTSASERIQAVNQSYELSKVDRSITQLLINTLNFDPNVNVRLAACQALIRFKDEPEVVESLIQSLGVQTDPNVQITLIESLVAIKEKRAFNQLQQLADDQQALDIVRLKAQEGLSRLNHETTPAT